MSIIVDGMEALFFALGTLTPLRDNGAAVTPSEVSALTAEHDVYHV
jgi:hypothetical protein